MIVQLAGWILIHSLWEGMLIAGLTFVALSATRSAAAQTRYLLCVFALGMLVVAPVLTALAMSGSSGALSGASMIGRVVAGNLDRSFPALLAIWGVGVAAFSLRFVAGLARTSALVTTGTGPAPEWVADLAAKLARQTGVRRVVRVLESSRVHVPLVAGWLRPALLLPTSLLTGLTPYQLELIIAHELAHVRRYDYLVNVCQTVVETLLFYHPATWWISGVIRQEREHCCDDLTLQIVGGRARAAEYAGVLLAIEESRGMALGFATMATGGSLLKRVRRLIGPDTPHRTHRSRRAAIGALALVLPALVAGAISVSRNNGLGQFEPSSPRVPLAGVHRVGMSPAHIPARDGHAQQDLRLIAGDSSASRSRAVVSRRLATVPVPLVETAALPPLTLPPEDSQQIGSIVGLAMIPQSPNHLELERIAVEQLSSLDNEHAVATLRGIVTDNPDTAVRRLAVASLGELAPSPRALAALQQIAWLDPRPDVQVLAMKELQYFPDSRSLRYFLREVVRTHPNRDARWIATTLLGGA